MESKDRISRFLGSLFRSAATGPLSLEQKLDKFAACGLHLEAPFTADDLLKSWKREDFDTSGFDLVLVGLGMTEEQPPWRNHCRNAWHFDTECIEDHGSYARIAERMQEMAQGSLPLTDISDFLDLEGRVARLLFRYQDRPFEINCEVNDDWVDPKVFSLFVDLLAQSEPTKLYLSYDLHGQDTIIACVTKQQFAKLQRSGIAFQPLRL